MIHTYVLTIIIRDWHSEVRLAQMYVSLIIRPLAIIHSICTCALRNYTRYLHELMMPRTEV